MQQYIIFIPIIIYLGLTFFIALLANKHRTVTSSDIFIKEYFIGSRSMGGFILAMSIIASYTSASSFIGGPGAAYEYGLSWVLLAMIQAPVAFLTLGIFGKRFAIMARRVNAVTLVDFLRVRYQSDILVVLCCIGLLTFFMAAMLAQFVGGARLFQTITGFSYEYGLVIFVLTVTFYTVVGGFRAVVMTDALQGIVMAISSILILFVVIYSGGGVENCILTLKNIDPGLITPTGPDGFLSPTLMFSFWILIGFGVLGLPQTAQKCMGYNNSYSMHKAMIVGTVVIGVMLLNIHLAGVFGRVIMPDLSIGDFVMPSLIIKLLPEFWAGVFIAGPLAAIMSTVDTMLLLASAVIVKDIYIHYKWKGDISFVSQKHIKKISTGCTFLLGLLVFVLALDPPSLLVWINLFAFGGLEVVFLWPILFGIYWKKANATGAICAIITGMITFWSISLLSFSFGNVYSIVPSLLLSGIAFIIGSHHGQPTSKEILWLFWGEKE